MSERRVIVEHPDGRRLSINEVDFDRPEANPLNHGGTVQHVDLDAQTESTSSRAATPVDDWVSLKKAGFVPVMAVNHEGHEVPLKGK